MMYLIRALGKIKTEFREMIICNKILNTNEEVPIRVGNIQYKRYTTYKHQRSEDVAMR